MRANLKLRSSSLITTLVLAGSVQAAMVAGVNVPETATLAGQQLVLNGAGLAKKGIVKVYVAALYLPSKIDNAEAALAQSGAAKITMTLLRDVDKQLSGSLSDGFVNNNTPADVTKFKARLDRFSALFIGIKAGQPVEIDFAPGAGTTVAIAGKARGTIEGDDFAKAALRIWLGPKPPSDALQAGMLGKS